MKILVAKATTLCKDTIKIGESHIASSKWNMHGSAWYRNAPAWPSLTDCGPIQHGRMMLPSPAHHTHWHWIFDNIWMSASLGQGRQKRSKESESKHTNEIFSYPFFTFQHHSTSLTLASKPWWWKISASIFFHWPTQHDTARTDPCADPKCDHVWTTNRHSEKMWEANVNTIQHIINSCCKFRKPKLHLFPAPVLAVTASFSGSYMVTHTHTLTHTGTATVSLGTLALCLPHIDVCNSHAKSSAEQCLVLRCESRACVARNAWL